MFKFPNIKNAAAFLWPKDIGEETHGVLGDELRAYKKAATWVVAVMLILTAGIVVVERSLTGGYTTAWLVGVAGSSILMSLILDRRKGGGDMVLSRTVLNVATAVAFWGSTYMNGTLSLHVSPAIPVFIYLLNPVRPAFVASLVILGVQVGLLATMHSDAFLTPGIIRLSTSIFVVTCVLHVGNCYFQRLLSKIDRSRIEQEEFSSVLAHEIRTPLTTLMGTIELAQIDGRFKELPLLYKDLSTSATALLDIVNSTLDYRMIQAGNFEPKNTQFDPDGLIKTLVKQTYLLPNAEHVKITTNNQTPEGIALIGDAKKIMQILTNLLSNAVKFTPPGGEVSITSQLSERNDATLWRLCIKDTGIGIDSSDLDLIFRPFTQASQGQQRRFGGTGLGLALSQSIAHALGGKITVKSIVGEGSTFTLDLPVAVANTASNLEKVVETSLSATPRDNLSILLVEDHPLNAEIVSEMVKHIAGKEPTVVHTAEEAIVHLSENTPFDLILMDINLGAGMTGLEASRQIKNVYGDKAPPIVALTAGVMEENKRQAYAAGMSGFLAKPLDPIAMRNVLLSI